MGAGGSDVLTGGAGNDYLHGYLHEQSMNVDSDAADTLYGGAGDDYLYGGAGDDVQSLGLLPRRPNAFRDEAFEAYWQPCFP